MFYVLSAYLTEEATSMLLLFLSKWWKYNYDQKSITENASVTLSKWTIFIPVSKFVLLSKQVASIKEKIGKSSRYNLVKFAVGVS